MILHTNSPWVCVIKVCSSGYNNNVKLCNIYHYSAIECQLNRQFTCIYFRTWRFFSDKSTHNLLKLFGPRLSISHKVLLHRKNTTFQIKVKF